MENVLLSWLFYSGGIVWTGMLSPNVAACSSVWCYFRPCKGVINFLILNCLLPYTSLSPESLDPYSHLFKKFCYLSGVLLAHSDFRSFEMEQETIQVASMCQPLESTCCFYCCYSGQPDPGFWISRYKQQNFKY